MNLRILFILLALFGPLSAKTQLLDSTVVASLEEDPIDSIFICKKDYRDFSKWYLCVKQNKGYDTTLLNEPYDAMGVESMEIYPVEMAENPTRLVRIQSETIREHSYGGTGGWAHSREEVMIYDLETKKMIFEGIFRENSSHWTSIVDSISEEEGEYTEVECGFSYDFEIDSSGNITFFNYKETKKGCSVFPEISAGIYIFKKGEYFLKEED